MSISHYIIKCKICAVTISQCNCIFGDKIVKEGICFKCEKNICKHPVEEYNKVYSYNKDEN